MSARRCRLRVGVLQGLFVLALGAGSAAAQTTVTLSAPDTQVWSNTLRGGTYASTNNRSTLETRASSDLSYRRHALLKFDTQNTIPAGSDVTSAILTLTVKQASADATRRIGVYQVTESWEEPEATWNRRKSGTAWRTGGGTLGNQLDVQTVGNAVGTRVSFDVTALVKQAVAGSLGSSRYTRLALADLDEWTKESWRSYYIPEDDSANRPTLTVTYGGAAAAPQAETSAAGQLLRIMHWNIQKNGWNSAGVYDPNTIANWIAKYNPEVISFNEIEKWNSYSFGADGVALYKSLLEQKMGGTWYTWDVQDYGNWSDKGLRSVVFSRYPFLSTYRDIYSVGTLHTVGGATIEFNGRLINFMTTHFDPYSKSYRLTQAKELVGYANGFAEDRIICGDFNEQMGNLTAITAKYYDAWSMGKYWGGASSAPDNPYGYTRNSRIDFIFYSRGQQHLTLKKIEVVDTRNSSGVMASDHRPLYAEFLVQ